MGFEFECVAAIGVAGALIGLIFGGFIGFCLGVIVASPDRHEDDHD